MINNLIDIFVYYQEMSHNMNVIAKLTEKINGIDDLKQADMIKYLKEAYKEVDTGKKTRKSPKKAEEGVEKKKREPSAYNIFMKEKMAELKQNGETLTGKELMQKVAGMWNDYKSASSGSEEEKLSKEDEETAKKVVEKIKKSVAKKDK